MLLSIFCLCCSFAARPFAGAQTQSRQGLLHQHFKVSEFGYSRNDSFTAPVRHHPNTVPVTFVARDGILPKPRAQFKQADFTGAAE
jgi:hypothetical protein